MIHPPSCLGKSRPSAARVRSAGRRWENSTPPPPFLRLTSARTNNRRISVFTAIVTQSAAPASRCLIRQEVLPSDGFKTREVDIGMPGIPALYSPFFSETRQTYALAPKQYVRKMNVAPFHCTVASWKLRADPQTLATVTRLWTHHNVATLFQAMLAHIHKQRSSCIKKMMIEKKKRKDSHI